MTNPKHPMYIVSKGRADTMITSRSLSRMQIPHNIVIEPQDYESYNEALDNFGIREWVTLLVAPFSNHGDGPGRARNWAWDHAIANGAEWHWVMDDNISDFYRLHNNQRIRVESGALFRACEDFTERFENVPMAGLQYRFFIAPNQHYPPYVKNTRIYSCNLIRNDCKHRWRGRYNEDTILSLDILKDGDCTIQYNFFLQGKCATQTVKGGNTDEFYFKEVGFDEKTGKAIQAEELVDKGKDKKYNEAGTIAKSQMLEDIHPDVSRVVWKYDRWHHYVDYSPFKKNKLILKKDVELPNEPNNYGLKLITNYGLDD
jgi:hypothetical protein